LVIFDKRIHVLFTGINPYFHMRFDAALRHRRGGAEAACEADPGSGHIEFTFSFLRRRTRQREFGRRAIAEREIFG
jgi:hypothetical protein